MSRALRSGARVRVIARLIGQVLMLQAAFSLVPIVFCYATGDSRLAGALCKGAIGAGVVGWLLSRLPKPALVQKNEVLSVAALSFLISALLNSSSLSTAGIGWMDAFFESVSAVTTTGLSTVEDVHTRSRGFLFLRAWIQWYGGLGMVAFAVALSLNPSLLARRIASGGAAEQDAIGGTRPHYRRIIMVYVTLTVVGFLAIWACGAEWFNSLALAFAAVSTGGFSPVKGSLISLPSIATAACLTLSLAASLPLVYYHLLYRNRIATIAKEPQWKALLAATTVTALAFTAVSLASAEHWGDALWHGWTMAASAQSSAGFSTLNADALPDSGKIALIVSMFIGGGAGSTAGGTKLLRWIVICKVAYATIQRSVTPRHSVTNPKLAGSLIQEDEVKEAATIIFLYAAAVLTIWFAFVWIGHDPIDSLFDTVSALGTAGLTAGVCGPDLASSHKLLLCFAMLLGRLELVAWLVILWPPTWLAPRRTWEIENASHANTSLNESTDHPKHSETE